MVQREFIQRRFSAPYALFFAFFLAACAPKKPPQEEPIAVPEEAVIEIPNCDEVEQHLETVKQALNEQRSLNSSMQLRLLEKDAQVQELERQMAEHQAQLDEAISETVRAKAKLRSMGSKADAASIIAETEFALNTYNAEASRYDNATVNAAIRQAAQLLSLSTEEFDKENYGGSLYLASQAAEKIKRSRSQFTQSGLEPSVEGETIFLSGLALELTENTRVREGPGLDFKTITILKKGMTVTGFSYSGQWIRISTETGIVGWVFQDLISKPE